MMRLLVLAAVCGLVLTGSAIAQDRRTELIPEDAAFGMVVKSLDDLREKGDKLHKEIGATDGKLPRPTDLFRDLFKFLIGSEKGINGKGSAAIVVPSPTRLKLKPADDPTTEALNLLSNVVVVVPITSVDDMAANFGFKKGQWKPGTIKKVQTAQAFIFSKIDFVLLLTDRVAYAGLNENAIKVYRTSLAKPLSGALSPRQAQAFKEADGVLHVAAQHLGGLWKEMVMELEKWMLLNEAEDDRIIKGLSAALREGKSATLALKVEDGLKFDLVTSFTKADGDAAKFLSVMRGGPGTSDLDALPAASPILAYAAKGDGERNFNQARALLKVLLGKWLGIDVAIGKEDRQRLVDAFGVLYRHLKGSRAALYSVDPKRAEKVGQCAAVVILDLDDPSKHLEGWKGVVEVANRAAPKVTKGDRTSVPKFAFSPKADKLDGADVDVLSVEVPGLPKDAREEYVALLGPDWNRVKMVTVGKRVVGLFGSDTELLREAVKNVKDEKKGLSESKAFAEHLKGQPAERKVEFHVALGAYAALLDRKEARPTAWSSTALVVETDRVEMRLVIPVADLREVLGAAAAGQ